MAMTVEMQYERYIEKFTKESEDDCEDIKQLKYNALWEEDEDGFILVLPGFKPYRAPCPSENASQLVFEGFEAMDAILKKQESPRTDQQESSLTDQQKQHDQMLKSMMGMVLDKGGWKPYLPQYYPPGHASRLPLSNPRQRQPPKKNNNNAASTRTENRQRRKSPEDSKFRNGSHPSLSGSGWE